MFLRANAGEEMGFASRNRGLGVSAARNWMARINFFCMGIRCGVWSDRFSFQTRKTTIIMRI
jgi:hypothetical protein